MPVVYIDVVFLVNVVMDAVLLWTTGWIAKRALRNWRVFGGALLGASYALLLFVPALSILTTWPGKALVSVLMILTVYPTRNWIEILRMTLLFYFVSFVFAGATLALHFAVPGASVTNGLVLTNQRYAIVTSFAGLTLVAAIPVSFYLIRYSFMRVRQIRVQAGMVYRIAVHMGGQRVEFTGLLDTGNRLRDPVSQRPVCLVEGAVMKPLLPRELHPVLDRQGDLVQALGQVTDFEWVNRVSLVPFQGAGGIRRITIAVRPEQLEVWQKDSWKTVGVPCLLAVHNEKLSLDNRFQAILHTDVITGDDGFEGNFTSTRIEHETPDSSTTLVDTHPRGPSWRL